MKYIIGLLIFASLVSCTTTQKAPSKPQSLTATPHAEKQSMENVEVIIYNTPFTGEVSGEPLTCEQEDALFLLSTPHEIVSVARDLYQSIMRNNFSAQEYASKYFEHIEGKSSMENFVTYQMLAVEKMKVSVMEQQNLLSLFLRTVPLQERIFLTYPHCSALLDKVLLSKKVDPKKKGCELEQHKVIIFDPFEMKKKLLDGIRLESTIQGYFFKINEIIDQHINQKISQEEMTAQVNAVYEAMLAEDFPKRSADTAKVVRESLDRSYSVKDECLKKKKK